jgi:hypothetical protein
MLGPNWRLRATNSQNQSITATVTAVPFRFDSSGQEVRGSEVTLINAASMSATTGTAVSSDQTNTGATPWVGLYLTAQLTAGTATNGTGAVTLTMERSTDGGTTWPTNEIVGGVRQDLGVFVGAHRLVNGDGTNARRRNFTLR